MKNSIVIAAAVALIVCSTWPGLDGVRKQLWPSRPAAVVPVPIPIPAPPPPAVVTPAPLPSPPVAVPVQPAVIDPPPTIASPAKPKPKPKQTAKPKAAKAEDGPDLPYSCSQVRWAVATFPQSWLDDQGNARGITEKQRRQAQDCLVRK